MMGWLVLLSAFGLSLAAFVPEAAAHGGDPALVHACVNSRTGKVRIVAPDEKCKPRETAIDWAIAASAGGVAKVLTEIQLISSGFVAGRLGGPIETEVMRFLWEPHRYDPAPSEIFFEILLSGFLQNASETITFELHDITNDLPIAGSSFTFVGPTQVRGRFRTGNLAPGFPAAPAEIALVAHGNLEFIFNILRSAVLVQQ
jgi:hypothetical protein